MEVRHNPPLVPGFLEFARHYAKDRRTDENAIVPGGQTYNLAQPGRQHAVEVAKGEIYGRKQQVSQRTTPAFIVQIINAHILLAQDLLGHAHITLVGKASSLEDAIIMLE